MFTLRSFSPLKDFFEVEEGLGRLSFLVHLRGVREFEFPGFAASSISGPTLSIQFVPPGATRVSRWKMGDQVVGLYLGYWIDELPSHIYEALSKKPVFQMVKSDDNVPFIYNEPLSRDLEYAGLQLLNTALCPELLSYYIKAKTDELACLALDQIISSEPSRTRLGASEDDRVRVALGFIRCHLRSPPNLQELSRRVGLSPQELSRGIFRLERLHYKDFLFEERMYRAYEMLLNSDKALKVIAHEVGYNHVSNFCSAFKRRFDRTPNELRQGD